MITGTQNKKKRSTTSSSGNSTISTFEMRRIMDKLKQDRVRDSTKQNYYSVWKNFNNFFLRLDVKPSSWEDRLVLFTGYLVQSKKRSQTVCSYISAIKNILRDDGIVVNEDKFLITSLTRACKLKNDKVILRLPIQKGLLHLIVDKMMQFFNDINQPYLSLLYRTLFSTYYFGMFRVGELTASPHVIKVGDVQLAENKDKILFILCTSKTHGRGTEPQKVKISSQPQVTNTYSCFGHICPFQLLREYIAARPTYTVRKEPFFVFRDCSTVKPSNTCATLKQMLNAIDLDPALYNMHSFRSGRTVDLHKLRVKLDFIKIFGRWKSNAIYSYLKY